MLFMVGIETPQNKDESWGMIVPVFEEFGYGCFAAADDEKDIISNVKLAILDMLQVMHEDGQLLKKLDTGFKDYSSAYPDFQKWLAVEVDDTLIKGKKERFNVSWDKRFLERVDTFVKENPNFSDRSVFLAMAADEKMKESSIAQDN